MRLLQQFSTELKSIKWLEKVIWNGEKACPHCGGLDNISTYRGKKHTYWHRDCRKAFTVKTKTMMHSSQLPTNVWVVAIYSILTGRKGISSMQLSKELDITQKSAWFMSQRIREAYKQGEFKLANIVEIDETGGKESNKHLNKKIKPNQQFLGNSIHKVTADLGDLPISNFAKAFIV